MNEQSSKEVILQKTLYVLVRQVGLAPEEVAKLRLSDLHLAGKNPNISFKPGQGTSPKTVELDLEAHRALVGWLVARPDSASDFLFLEDDSSAMDPFAIEQAVKNFEQSGLGFESKPVKPEQLDVPGDTQTSEAEQITDELSTAIPPSEEPEKFTPPPVQPMPPVPPPTPPEMGVPPRPVTLLAWLLLR